jgi:hypothetical protein
MSGQGMWGRGKGSMASFLTVSFSPAAQGLHKLYSMHGLVELLKINSSRNWLLSKFGNKYLFSDICIRKISILIISQIWAEFPGTLEALD